jgi:transposase-like protein
VLIKGTCHCANIALELEWNGDPPEIPARACGCSFCLKHGGVWTSNPSARLVVTIRDPALVSTYAFGTRTATFHVCSRCGVVPLVTSEIAKHLYAVVNVNVLENVDLKLPTFDGHLNESNTDLRRCSMEYTPRRKLTREFKLEAVRQVALSEKPKAQLARELGVRVGQLRTWRLEFEKEAVTGIAKPDRSAAEDVEQLRRENAKLKMEIEILKKAAIYFAREAK